MPDFIQPGEYRKPSWVTDNPEQAAKAFWANRAAEYAAAQQPPAGKRPFRCRECGRKLWPVERHPGEFTTTCASHPGHDLVELTDEFVRAYWYVSWLRVGADGWIETSQDTTLPAPSLAQVTEWIGTYSPDRYPGTNMGELAYAAVIWDGWGRRTLADIDRELSGAAAVVTRPGSAVLL